MAPIYSIKAAWPEQEPQLQGWGNLHKYMVRVGERTKQYRGERRNKELVTYRDRERKGGRGGHPANGIYSSITKRCTNTGRLYLYKKGQGLCYGGLALCWDVHWRLWQ